MKLLLGPRSYGALVATICSLLLPLGATFASAAGTAKVATFPQTPPPVQITRDLTPQQAARAGVLRLTSKGGFEGDDVEAELDGKKVLGPITVTVHVEYAWAEGHSVKENEIVRSDLPRLERETEKRLNGGKYKTSKGEPINFDLDFRFREAGQPPTPGYEQVKIINPRTDLPEPDPDRRAGLEEVGVPNDPEKVVNGTFPLTDLKPEVLAHESLHLVGLDDAYTDVYSYKGHDVPLPEQGMSPKALADYLGSLKPPIPNPSIKNVEARNLPGTGRCDIMGTGSDSPCARISKKDLKWIESQAGIQVETRPGEVLLSKAATTQNLAVGYVTRIIAPRGGTTVAPGVSAYCIDHAKYVPEPGTGFDVGPTASSLPGWAGVVQLLTLNSELQPALDDQIQGLQPALWNLTDGTPLTDAEDGYDTPARIAEARSLLSRAGVAENSNPQGLPHFGDPDAGAATTGAVDASGAIMAPLPAEEVAPPPAISVGTVALVPGKVDAGRAPRVFLVLGVGGEVSSVGLKLQRRKGHRWKTVKALPSHELDAGETELPLELGSLKAGRYRVRATLSGPAGPPLVRTAALSVGAAAQRR